MAMTLEPCPFCGKQPRRERDGRRNVYFCPEHTHYMHAEEWNRCAHLTQPAQAVDVVAIREVIDDLSEWGKTDMQLAMRAATLARALSAEKAGWRDIATAPEKVRVLVTGGDTPNGIGIATNDPDRYTPYHESHARLPSIAAWYSDETRGSGKIWPAPTHWMPLPAAPTPDKEACTCSPMQRAHGHHFGCPELHATPDKEG